MSLAPETVAQSLPAIRQDGFWLPIKGSTLASDIDHGWNLALIVSVVFFVLVMGAMFYFIAKYKRKDDTTPTEVMDHSTKLEIAWSVIPLIIVFVLFAVGLKAYVKASVAPRDAYDIRVQAQKWSWTFMYPDGTVSGGKLVVPKGRPVRLIMSSTDVLHSLWIPEMRVKQDVVPGMYTTMWFEATTPGDTLIQCTEFCGKDHSAMLATLTVMEPPEFDAWLASQQNFTGTPEELGQKLYTERGCKGCHSIDGAAGAGPTFKGLFGKSEKLTTGESVNVDENYIRESINNPAAKVVAGFAPGVMPVFQGTLKEDELAGIIAFIKAQK